MARCSVYLRYIARLLPKTIFGASEVSLYCSIVSGLKSGWLIRPFGSHALSEVSEMENFAISPTRMLTH